mmetsp:Transcript_8665/g.26004  ORF Transcript_8665/g.26004 Transcript_8665/m.26004 type:complete len:223 (+) Transcript_8665:836-1504(+)
MRAVSFGSTLIITTAAYHDGANGGKRPIPVVVAKIQPKMHVRVIPSRAPAGLKVFQDLPGFVRGLRDRLITPSLNGLRIAAGFPEQGCFNALSPEVKTIILGFLDPLSLCRAAQVCRELHDLASADALWRQHVQSVPEATPPFKDALKHSVQKRVQEARRRAIAAPPPFQTVDGDYDIYPQELRAPFHGHWPVGHQDLPRGPNMGFPFGPRSGSQWGGPHHF